MTHTPHPPATSDPKAPSGSLSADPTSELVLELCQALADDGVSYCHWKSNDALDRSASGQNDLDLLVGRNDIHRFAAILRRLGFKEARAPGDKALPGVSDYFGYDDDSDCLIHVHAHYQLILGHDRTKNYRLPVEGPYLKSAVDAPPFKVPQIEFEYIVFVVRMMLKHSTWDVVLGGEGSLSSAERRELAYLQARVDESRVQEILLRHLPYIEPELFDECVAALGPDRPVWAGIRAGRRLQNSLSASARRPVWLDTYLKLWRRGVLMIRRRVLRRGSPKYRLEAGGALIALVGGDGAGKSTAVDGLHEWLSRHFDAACVHMGKPPWSWPTIGVRGVLKIGNLLRLYPGARSFQDTLEQMSPVSPGYPHLIRELCRARDRYWTYIGARRRAAAGALVILDRFPVSKIKLMDGPQVEQFVDQLSARPQGKLPFSPKRSQAFTRFLASRERRYYGQVAKPELLIVLRVDPEVAVRRKTDESADSVRERSTEIWKLDWEGTNAHVIDASKTKEEVLAELKSLVWSAC